MGARRDLHTDRRAAFGVRVVALVMLRTRSAVGLKLARGSFAAAGVLVYSMRPRRDKFEAPGPRVTEHEPPALFRNPGALPCQTPLRALSRGAPSPHSVRAARTARSPIQSGQAPDEFCDEEDEILTLRGNPV